MIRWLVIDRRMVKRAGFGPWMEGTATIGPEPLTAPDKASAEALMPRNNKYHRFSVIAECSWRQMTKAERENLMLDHYVPRASPKSHYRNAYNEVPSDAP